MLLGSIASVGTLVEMVQGFQVNRGVGLECEYLWLVLSLTGQLQMDKLPSRHAISEVMTWISLMENVIQKDEEDIKHAIGYKAIHEYLQKYKAIQHFFIFNFS